MKYQTLQCCCSGPPRDNSRTTTCPGASGKDKPWLFRHLITPFQGSSSLFRTACRHIPVAAVWEVPRLASTHCLSQMCFFWCLTYWVLGRGDPSSSTPKLGVRRKGYFRYECYRPTRMDDRTSLLLFFPSSFSFFLFFFFLKV